MTPGRENLFEGFLRQHDQDAWWTIVDRLAPDMHEVDVRATRIWFYFWPIWLSRALQETEAADALARELELKGNYRLSGQVDSSHKFLYGHRFWPYVKKAVIRLVASTAPPGSLDLVEQIRSLARETGSRMAIDGSLLVGITAVAFNTLQQVGLLLFERSPGEVHIDRWAARRSPDAIVRARKRNAGQGPVAFLQGLRREFTIIFDENVQTARFKLIHGQELTQAAMMDPVAHPYADARCVPREGAIPNECRSAACGTCWVGVLAGEDRLEPVGDLERRRMPRFGYIDTDEPLPIIRLACKARAFGDVTVVIPPWNGVFGRYLEGEREIIGGAAASADEESALDPRRH